MTPERNLRPAMASDLSDLMTLQAAYYGEDGYPFSAPDARDAWEQLLSDDALGRAWLIIEDRSSVVGYVVLTLGFSLEYRGRDGFVDELYLIPERRGQGLGRMALMALERAAAGLGVKALHLEVERSKGNARALYRERGFEDHERILMTKLLNGTVD